MAVTEPPTLSIFPGLELPPAPSSLLQSTAGNKPADANVGLALSMPDRPRLEFSVPIAAIDETHFRHSGWRHRRQKVWDALSTTQQSVNRRQAFMECGASLWVQKRDDGQEYRIVCNTCHDRFCVPCANVRARRLNFNLSEILKGKHPRFLTLTLRHSNTPLVDQLDRLFRSFTKLRHRGLWKAAVQGGAAFLELKVSEFDGLWHPHLHCLIDGSFIDQKRLSEEWHAVTGDSSIVDIRSPKDLAGVAKYVIKYVTKPADKSVFDHPDKLQEMVVALKGRRLCTTFGTWRKLPLEEPPSDGHEWAACASLSRIVEGFDAGDESAIAILQALDRKYPNLIKQYVQPPQADSS